MAESAPVSCRVRASWREHRERASGEWGSSTSTLWRWARVEAVAGRGLRSRGSRSRGTWCSAWLPRRHFIEHMVGDGVASLGSDFQHLQGIFGSRIL